MHDQLFLVGGSHSAVKEAYKTSNWEVRKGTSYYQGHHPIAQEHIEVTLGVLGLEAPYHSVITRIQLVGETRQTHKITA